MPLPTSPEIIQTVVSLRSSGTSFEDIAKTIGKSVTTTKFVWYKNKPKGKLVPTNNNGHLHYLTEEDRARIRQLDLETPGKRLSAEKAGQKLGISAYNVYKARRMAPVTKRKRTDHTEFDALVGKMKDVEGMTLVAIGKKLHKPKGTVSSAYYRFKQAETKRLNAKGEVDGTQRGATHNGNGNGHKGWTAQNFEGAFANEVIKLSETYAPAYQRYGPRYTAEALRARCAELLQDEVLR